MKEVIAGVLQGQPLRPEAFVAALAQEVKRHPELRGINDDPTITAHLIRQHALRDGVIIKVRIGKTKATHFAIPREGVPAA